MKADIYIGNDHIGQTNFKILDESMGGLNGELNPNENFEKYRNEIQYLTDKKGIANIIDFKFRIVLDDNLEINPEGGIGISDFKGYEEIIIECARNERKIIDRIKKKPTDNNVLDVQTCYRCVRRQYQPLYVTK